MQLPLGENSLSVGANLRHAEHCGPDGSMHNAVDGMMVHYRFTLACFTLGLICFMLSALLYAWMQFDWTLALPMTLLIVYFLFIL